MMPAVLIYEDNESLRESIGDLVSLSPQLFLVGSYNNVRNAEAQVRELHPNVILMDIDMPGVTGIEAVKAIRRFDKQVAIIMLTVFDDTSHVYDAICAGASGYLLKKHISDRLMTAIEEVLDGGAPMSPGIARLVVQRMHHIPADADRYHLTAREKEILTSLAKGNSFKMIASVHGISIDTVRSHMKKIYDKLQVHSQTEAVSKAVNEHLV